VTTISAGRRILGPIAITVLLASSACTLFGSDQTDQAGSTSTSPNDCATAIEAVATGAQGDVLSAVAGDRPGEVWAVGTHWRGAGVGGPLATLWDGSTWTTASLKADEFRGIHLEAVDVTSTGDAWAVGFGKRSAPAIIHWDGRTWSAQDAPVFPQSDLLGVSAAWADDVWAVGSTGVGSQAHGGVDRALILRLREGAWAHVRGADTPGIGSLLTDVAPGPGGVWAVGSWLGPERRYHPLAERWDGSAWRIVSTPTGDDDELLSAVAAIDGTVWAVGWSWSDTGTRSIVLRSDGTSWSDESLPGATGARMQVTDVEASGDGVVVVGRAVNDEGIRRPVAFRWDGSGWTEIAVTSPGAGNGGFDGLTDLGSDGWFSVGAMGGEGGGGAFVPIVARGC
jgi:hypothetical protein